MAGWVYRIRGSDARTGAPREVFFRAGSSADAARAASLRGFVVTAAEQVDETQLPEDAVVLTVPPHAGPTSELLARPVRTIATGVFVGLLLWAAFVVVIGLILGLLAAALGYRR
jgi:hypothetical protein